MVFNSLFCVIEESLLCYKRVCFALLNSLFCVIKESLLCYKSVSCVLLESLFNDTKEFLSQKDMSFVQNETLSLQNKKACSFIVQTCAKSHFSRSLL